MNEKVIKTKEKKNFNYKGKGFKTLVFNVINVLVILITFYLLSRVPEIAKEVKSLRSESIAAESSSEISILESEIERSQSKIDQVRSSFADENGFLDFISQVNRIKESGILIEFNFPVAQPSKDASGNLGFPVSLTFRGTLDQVNSEVERVLQLDYLVKVIAVDLEVSTGVETVILRVSSFLYIDEEFKG